MYYNNLKHLKFMKLTFKKHLLTLVVVLTVTGFTVAQDLHFGFQASPSWSWLNTTNAKLNGSGTALGLKLGLIIENRFSEAYSISSGIGFHFNSGGSVRTALRGKLWQESYDYFENPPRTQDTFAKETKLRYSLNYVEIPIGLKMRTAEGGNHIRWFAEPLLTFGFRSNAKGAVSSAISVPDQEKINIKKEVGGINLSWGLGAGGEYIISNNTAIVVGLYYQNGFTDVTKDGSIVLFNPAVTSGQQADNSKGTLKSLTLRLGVMF